jgi:uncharacterized protein (TIGR02452 family)
MSNRNAKVVIANDTLHAITQGFYTNKQGVQVAIKTDNDFAINNSIHYKAADFSPVLAARDVALKTVSQTVFEVTPETTLQATERLSKVHDKLLCLNFASAKNPGGGFLGGSQAQEETLARSSALYPCLERNMAMYNLNRQENSCLYSDAMIYSPAVPVFKKDDGEYLDTYYKVSFITSPAVNAGVVREREPENIDNIDAVMLLRLEKVLSVAVAHGYRNLVLGAWGCGVFRNRPNDVARYFVQHLKENPTFHNCFDTVVFAIYSTGKSDENIKPFLAEFL